MVLKNNGTHFILDRLDANLKHQCQLGSCTALSLQDALEEFKKYRYRLKKGGTIKPLPEHGWVEVYMQKNWDAVWRNGMQILLAKASKEFSSQ